MLFPPLPMAPDWSVTPEFEVEYALGFARAVEFEAELALELVLGFATAFAIEVAFPPCPKPPAPPTLLVVLLRTLVLG